MDRAVAMRWAGRRVAVYAHELATGSSAKSLHRLVHPSPSHETALNVSQAVAQTGQGEDLHLNRGLRFCSLAKDLSTR